MRSALLALCLALVATIAGAGATAGAPIQLGAGLWSAAASLPAGREEHTATLLHDGDVLVVGGTDGRGTALASAELYHPQTNRWTPAASMAATRLDHTATLLPSGKVLVAGGLDGPIPSNSLASAELYDPSTNSWSVAASMNGSRSRHTATLLQDGRVLVVGGLSVTFRPGGLSVGQPLDAEVYDPKTDRWSATGPMALYRRDQSATGLPDGRVVVTGSQNDTTFNTTEIYNPASGRWSGGAPMTSGRSGHQAVLLQNGDVLVLGGVSQGPNSHAIDLTSVEIFHPGTNRWSAAASMSQAHIGDTATLLGDGRVLVLGGSGRAELYDPVRNHWSFSGPSMDRYQQTATRLVDGRVLITGGYGIDSLNSALVYDPEAAGSPLVEPVDRRPLLAAALIGLLMVLLSTPPLRRRLKALRPSADSPEWIE